MAAQTSSLPLYEVVHLKSYLKRFTDTFLLLLLLSLLVHRILSIDGNCPLVYLLAFACEAWFTIIWAMVVSTKWSPVQYKTYPDRLLQQVESLPPVDVFVTTANPKLEPPIIAVNTVLSFLAADYEPHKLACYVSDDSGTPVTLYALIQASEFAKHWVPFCKKYNIQVRAPFRYFETPQLPSDAESPEFQQEYQDIKNKYDQLDAKVEEACKSDTLLLDSKDLEIFAKANPNGHESIVKVIHENGGISDGLPHLIYVAREKNAEHSHHYKAGAMNVLTRTSGVMTNAPFMLNLDCDMYNNNPQTLYHAMCLLLGSKSEGDCAYVQFPQRFYNGLKDDPFGNQLVVSHKKITSGINGIQGPFYFGTGCFHRRKVIYGLPLDQVQSTEATLPLSPHHVYGKSLNLINSIDHIGSTSSRPSISDSLDAAYEVAHSDYEHGTSWGINIGWLYGSVAEDSMTGITIQSKGYKSKYCDPNTHAIMGRAPNTGPVNNIQIKRWTTGLLEIFFTRKNPILLSLTTKLHLRQGITYTYIFIWGLRSIPELCYSLLPAYCLISNTSFLPKIDQPAWIIPFLLFLAYNLDTLVEYWQCGLSTRAWWNNQRATRINSSCGWLFGFIAVILKSVGLSETVFEVTMKDESDNDDGVNDKNSGRFTFDASPILIPTTTLVIVNLAAVGLGSAKIIWAELNGLGLRKVGFGPGEFVCCVWVLLMLSPYVKGLFGKRKYGIPSVTIMKSIAFAVPFVSLCYRAC